MMKFELESDIGVDDAITALVFRHPDRRFEIHLRNQKNRGDERPLLSASVLFDDDVDIHEAAERGEQHLGRFIDFLALATASRFRSVARICIFDWRVGITERRGLCYRYLPPPGRPVLALNTDIASTVEKFLSSDNVEVLRALRWFRYGMAAAAPDEQFQMIWFALETLAKVFKSVEKVPDRCASCREPLYCPKCQAPSQHRPYPHQAIEALFHRFIDGDSAALFAAGTAMRHALLHGDRTNAVAERYNVTLAELVDQVGQLAWVALMDAVARCSSEKGRWHLRLIQPSTFAHNRLEFVAEMARPCDADQEPSHDDFPPKGLDVKFVAVPASEGTSATDGERRQSPYVVHGDPSQT
jgi:hypothetical protein